MERANLRTIHNEADVIVTQQIVHLVQEGVLNIQVISEDKIISSSSGSS